MLLPLFMTWCVLLLLLLFFAGCAQGYDPELQLQSFKDLGLHIQAGRMLQAIAVALDCRQPVLDLYLQFMNVHSWQRGAANELLKGPQLSEVQLAQQLGFWQPVPAKQELLGWPSGCRCRPRVERTRLLGTAVSSSKCMRGVLCARYREAAVECPFPDVMHTFGGWPVAG
jgi:hypothetical protein